MALALVPGGQAITAAAQAGSGAARMALGEGGYRKGRAAVTWGYSLINGFSPIPLMLPMIPVKMFLFIVVFLLCYFAFGSSFWVSVLLAYLAQAVVTTMISKWAVDAFLTWGLGV
jgi:hypothetical protein